MFVPLVLRCKEHFANVAHIENRLVRHILETELKSRQNPSSGCFFMVLQAPAEGRE
jgi:hypothetical protein